MHYLAWLHQLSAPCHGLADIFIVHLVIFADEFNRTAASA